MKASLIIIGNELLNGKIKDLNTQTLSKFLFKMGIKLGSVQIVPDEKAIFEQTLSRAINKFDFVFTSGGLGPTKDDLTKNFLCSFFNKKAEFNKEVLELVLSHYKRGERVYNETTTHYHYFPKEFKAIKNQVGYAPGIFVNDEKAKVFSHPGVPSEFSSMLETIKENGYLKESESLFKNVVIKTWKLPEAKIFTEFAPTLWDDLSHLGEVSSLPHPMGVDIGVFIEAKDQDELQEKEKKIISLIKNTDISSYIWHIGKEQIEEVIIKEASDQGLKIGFAESCTGGLCASRITNFSGSSKVFWGSIVSYSNEVKMNCINVNEATLNSHGAVSLETAKEMAIGAKNALGVDIAVTTTGIAGPLGGSKDKPVGTVGIGVCSKNKTESKLHYLKGDREQLKYKFSQVALMTLLEEIRSL